MDPARVKQYKVLMSAFPTSPTAISMMGDQPSDQNTVNTVFQAQFKQAFGIFQGLDSGSPSTHFVIGLEHQTVTDISTNPLSFK